MLAGGEENVVVIVKSIVLMGELCSRDSGRGAGGAGYARGCMCLIRCVCRKGVLRRVCSRRGVF